MTQTEFKSYQRGRRQLTADVEFSKGMQFNNNLVDEGYMKTLVNYDIDPTKATLIPRPGLRFSELIAPYYNSDSMLSFLDLHNDDVVNVLDVKECIEKDSKYVQFILGNPSKIWIATQEVTSGDLSQSLKVSTYKLHGTDGIHIPNTTPIRGSIHGIPLDTEKIEYATPAGAFAFGNSYYFIGRPAFTQPYGFLRTSFSEDDQCYKIEPVSPKKIDPSEAVSYGYNMLLGDEAYTFANTAISGVLQFTGILPYSAKINNKLLMTPRPNEDVVFKCYFKGEVGKQYKFTMEWRHVGEDTWTSLQSLTQSPTYTIKAASATGEVCLEHDSVTEDALSVTFKVPTDNILVRVQAYPADSDTVEKAMTVGFDFSEESYGEANNVDPAVYDLTKCKGIESWHNRIVLYNNSEDPKILFISDLNDPSYFPYPNNISIYDEPIICVKAYLDSLLVFTTSKIHQVTLSADGTSWNSTVVQSNLYIKEEDKHLIQVVKNMVFFKSGEQYFMEVPKAQSSTGKLMLAPISSTITNFLKQFERNIYELVEDTYSYTGDLVLVNFYNYLSYEDVCNNYVFRIDERSYLNVVLLYNVNTRTWRVHTFESQNMLRPVKPNATERSDLVSIGSCEQTQVPYTVTATSVSVESNILPFVTSYVKATGINFDFMTHGSHKVRVSFFNRGSFESAYHTVDFEPSGKDPGRVIMADGSITLIALRNPETRLWDVEITATQAVFNTNTDIELLATPELGGVFYQRVVSQCTPYGRVAYYFKKDLGSMRYNGAVIQIAGRCYTLESDGPNIYKPVDSDDFIIAGVYGVVSGFPDPSDVMYCVLFKDPVLANVRDSLTITLLDKTNYSLSNGCKVLQIQQFDDTVVEDFNYPLDELDLYISSHSSGWDVKGMTTVYNQASPNTYNNWQYFDTGFRRDNFSRNKRYREVQFQVDNIDGENLTFGLEFQIDGKPRVTYYAYDIEHVVDANDPNYGLIYVQPRVDMNIGLLPLSTPGETILGPGPNTWVLDQSFLPDLSLWKIRTIVTGKGMAPRIRLVSRNPYRYELLSMNWVYRLLYAR